MLTINPIGAFICDLALVESRFEADAKELSTQLTPTVAFHNRKVDVPQMDGLVAVGMESTVLVDVRVGSEDDLMISSKYVVGCTVAAPIPNDERSVDKQLVKYAIAANEGFVRTLIYQQALASQLPGPLIIPPMALDGTRDELD